MKVATFLLCIPFPLTARLAALSGLLALAAPCASGTLLDDPAAQHVAFPDERLVVNGLAWFDEETPSLRRLPTRLKATFPPKVWSRAGIPAGCRIRFTTDSRTLAVIGDGADRPTPSRVTAIAHSGIDVYVNARYHGSAAPGDEGRLASEWILGGDNRPREITLYLPYGHPFALQKIILEAGATLSVPRPYAVRKPVVYYGSSITQGIAASNPGNTFAALLGRWLDTDFINLGFAGSGRGEPELAAAVAEIDASCFVIDYWANPLTETYRRTLPVFVDIIRRAHPNTPIIVTGCYYNPSEDLPGDAGVRQIEKRIVGREFVAARRAAGDPSIDYVEGFDLFDATQGDALVDGRHANSMGFYFYARGLEPALRRALRLPPRDAPRR